MGEQKYTRRGLMAAISGFVVGTALKNNKTELNGKELEPKNRELEKTSQNLVPEYIDPESTNTVEGSITVKECKNRRYIGRGEEHLECPSNTNWENKSQEYKERYGDRTNWPTQRGDK